MTFLQKLRKSNHGNSRYFILNIVNIFRLESTRRGESTNFKHQNNIENKVYLTDFCRYQQIFSSSTTTLEILQENFNINIFFRFIFRRMQIFCPNSADNTMENRAISLVESSRDNSLISCPTSSALRTCVICIIIDLHLITLICTKLFSISSYISLLQSIKMNVFFRLYSARWRCVRRSVNVVRFDLFLEQDPTFPPTF